MTADVTDLARVIRDDPAATAVLRIGKVTALEAGPGSRARLDIAGTGWLGLDTDARIGVGDRVYAVQQGPVWVVVGKLTGRPVPAVPVGSLTLFAGAATAVPAGWLPADGRTLSRADFPELFTALGTTYGAPDAASFNLPNLANRVPVGVGPKALGATGGTETVVLTTAHLPAHTHGSAGAHTHTVRDSLEVASGTGSTVMEDTTGSTHSTGSAGGHAHASVGSDAGHPNMQPYLVINYIVRVL